MSSGVKATNFIQEKYGLNPEEKDRVVKITKNDGSVWFHGTIDQLIKEVEWQLEHDFMEKINIKTTTEEES